MRNFVINEKQEKILAHILKEEVYQEPQPQDPSMKKANAPYCIDPEKVLLVKRFLDKGFKRGEIEKVGANGLPKKVRIVGMMASNGDILKNMYTDQLHDLLIDHFQNMFSDHYERSLFMKKVMDDWFDNKIGVHGTLSTNFLKESVITSNEVDERASEANLNPTDKQKEAGNYKMGHFSVKGMPISIENPVGSERKFRKEDGSQGTVVMKNHYGYFTNTTGNGKDGDAVDVFIGPDIENFENVYVVDQNNKQGEFDESKVMLGFSSREQAKEAYLSNYDPSWDGFRAITTVSIDVFKKWLYRDHKQRKPFAEYVYIQKKSLDEGCLSEGGEYCVTHPVARMMDEKAAYEVAEELSAEGLDMSVNGTVVYVSIELDPLDPALVSDVMSHCKSRAKEYALTHSQVATSRMDEGMFSNLSPLDLYNNYKSNNDKPEKGDIAIDGRYLRVKKGSMMNIKDLDKDDVISETWFDWIGYPADGISIVCDNGLYNLIDMKGTILLPKWHEDVDDKNNDGEIYVLKDGKMTTEITRDQLK